MSFCLSLSFSLRSSHSRFLSMATTITHFYVLSMCLVCKCVCAWECQYVYRKCKTSTTATARSSIIVFHPVLFLLLCSVSVYALYVCVCVCFSLQYPFPLPTASAAAAVAAEHNKFLISFALYLLFFASITLQFLAQAKFLFFPFFIAFPLSAYASSCIIPIVFCCLCCCFGSHFKYRLCVFVCLCCVNI